MGFTPAAGRRKECRMGNVYARVTSLKSSSGGVGGRIDYISDPERQERVYDFFSTVSLDMWQVLSAERRADNKSSGQFKNCIEAKEITLALPHNWFELNKENIAENLAKNFESEYNVPCAVAIHIKGEGKNIHAHIVFSESELLSEPEIKIASRNMFYDENGKHCRTKKEICNEKGEIRQGCSVIKKGEVYKRKHFAGKKDELKSNNNAWHFKQHYAEMLDLKVYDKEQGRLKQFKYGKGNPKEHDIKDYNKAVQQFNKVLDIAVLSGVEKDAVRKTTEKVANEVRQVPLFDAVELIKRLFKRLKDEMLSELLSFDEKSFKNENEAFDMTDSFDKEILFKEQPEFDPEPIQPAFTYKPYKNRESVMSRLNKFKGKGQTIIENNQKDYDLER